MQRLSIISSLLICAVGPSGCDLQGQVVVFYGTSSGKLDNKPVELPQRSKVGFTSLKCLQPFSLLSFKCLAVETNCTYSMIYLPPVYLPTYLLSHLTTFVPAYSPTFPPNYLPTNVYLMQTIILPYCTGLSQIADMYTNRGVVLTSADIDLDGNDDLLIGSPMAPFADIPQAGRVCIILSDKSQNYSVYRCIGDPSPSASYSWFGSSVLSTKLPTGDHVLIVGSPMYRKCAL